MFGILILKSMLKVFGIKLTLLHVNIPVNRLVSEGIISLLMNFYENRFTGL